MGSFEIIGFDLGLYRAGAWTSAAALRSLPRRSSLLRMLRRQKCAHACSHGERWRPEHSAVLPSPFRSAQPAQWVAFRRRCRKIHAKASGARNRGEL